MRSPFFIPGTLLTFFFTFWLTACTQNPSSSEPAPDSREAQTAALVQRGRVIYQTQCIACHNSDPKRAGTLGPDVFNSSRELLEARLMKAEYPAGYKPKRETHTMVALPHLKNELDAVHAFLNSN